MTSDQLFMYLAPRCLIATLVINAVLAILCFIGHLKTKSLKRYWRDVRLSIIGVDTFLVFALFMIVFFLPNSAISGFLPTRTEHKTIVLPAEEIEVINPIEHENIIEIPSIVLPLEPQGEQAVVVDISSEGLKTFMDDFYGENVEFFNQRQKATFLSSGEGFQNFTGLDLRQIQYVEEAKTTTVNLDQLGYETIWLFTDLEHMTFEATTCKVMLYVPRAITQSELNHLKELGDVTVITIEKN